MFEQIDAECFAPPSATRRRESQVLLKTSPPHLFFCFLFFCVFFFVLLTCVLHIGAQLYSWCGRCYISACMVKPRIRRPLVSASARGARDQSLSNAEWQLLPQLLALLRSGALSSLLQSSGVSAVSLVPPNPTVAQKVEKEQKNSSIRDKHVESTTASGWKPVKSVKSTVSEARDKLL